MISQPLGNPVVVAFAAAALHATVFYFKNTRRTGEDFDPIRWLVTFAFGGVLGLVFFALGIQVPTEVWFFLLMAYAGMIAELEAAVKALLGGKYDKAREELRDAVTAGSKATEDVVGEGTERAVQDELNSRLPENKQVSPDAWEEAEDTESVDEFINRILEAKEEGQLKKAQSQQSDEDDVEIGESGEVLRGP